MICKYVAGDFGTTHSSGGGDLDVISGGHGSIWLLSVVGELRHLHCMVGTEPGSGRGGGGGGLELRKGKPREVSVWRCFWKACPEPWGSSTWEWQRHRVVETSMACIWILKLSLVLHTQPLMDDNLHLSNLPTE